MRNLIEVPFDGEAIATVETPEGVFVPLRPICARLGLSWGSQLSKLRDAPERWGRIDIEIPSQGGIQETVCVPLNRLAAWLFSVNANKVRADLKPALTRYQREAADVLDRHFRERAREAEAELKAADEAFARLAAFACAGNPLWARIRCLQHAGIPQAGLEHHLRRSSAEITEIVRAMEHAGAIAHADWEESDSAGKGYVNPRMEFQVVDLPQHQELGGEEQKET